MKSVITFYCIGLFAMVMHCHGQPVMFRSSDRPGCRQIAPTGRPNEFWTSASVAGDLGERFTKNQISWGEHLKYINLIQVTDGNVSCPSENDVLCEYIVENNQYKGI